VNTLYCLEEWRREQRISPPGDKIHPWGTNSPLGSKFAPRGEVKNGSMDNEKVREPGPGRGSHLGDTKSWGRSWGRSDSRYCRGLPGKREKNNFISINMYFIKIRHMFHN
jgi:hypothetical protein